ncbi:hypothetical protein WH47_06274 [Habropoda laboriosa]|uniref:SANTA domain-containing protein n=1 Tax=Habropoda laboriosa TaxID=597456 RepID=A0A0L7QTT2_9HYME|nr:hypothetical protein WH47_06274 [Habropoda laboriosa]
MYSSINTSYLQDFNIGREVVSSNYNLRNKSSQSKRFNSNRKMIVTSNVNNFSEENDCLADRFKMLPPTMNRVPRSSKTSENNMTHNVRKSLLSSQNKCHPCDINKEFPKRKQKCRSCNNSEKHNNTVSSIEISTDTWLNKKVTIFTDWIVMLNEKSQLIIKGMLQCGKLARSKPILRRLTSTNVESVYQHLYCLQGNITDNEYELPEYVRNKFYNGFPYDWKNVCKIWKTFIQQGCCTIFRWPTPITDSDDDIKSEVTDITFACSNSSEDKILNSKSFKESRVPRVSAVTNSSYNNLETKNKQSLRSNSSKKCDSSTQTYVSDITENSFHPVNIQTSKKQYNKNKENCIHQENRNSNSSCIRNEKKKLEDKLNVIINKLTNKSYSQECMKCMSNVIEILDCLNYAISYDSSKENTFNIKSSKLKGNNERNYKSLEYCQSDTFLLNNNMDKIIDTDSVLQKKRTFAEMNEANCSSISDSKSERCTEIPKISMRRMKQRKEALMKPYERKLIPCRPGCSAENI